MEIGIVGLGKMGMNLANNLVDHGYEVKGFDVISEVVENAKQKDIKACSSIRDLVASFTSQRIIWLMVPAGEPTEKALEELLLFLEQGDVVIEGGNSKYKDAIRRAELFETKGIDYLDCGTSGGISGARSNACLMIGGKKSAFEKHEKLFADIAIKDGYLYSGPSGSGHFLKMVHNGIEYGMMQAIGEGFQILEECDYDYDLAEVAKVWNHGSVVRSWLMELAEESFKKSPHLENYKGIVTASGEAKWTVETALDLEVPIPVIALSLMTRNRSQEEDSFSGKVVAALRNGFGGHEIVEK